MPSLRLRFITSILHRRQSRRVGKIGTMLASGANDPLTAATTRCAGGMRIEDLSAYPFWFTVIEMLQQNWAVVAPNAGGAKALFFFDSSTIFDELSFPATFDAEEGLRRNGFRRYADDKEA